MNVAPLYFEQLTAESEQLACISTDHMLVYHYRLNNNSNITEM